MAGDLASDPGYDSYVSLPTIDYLPFFLSEPAEDVSLSEEGDQRPNTLLTNLSVVKPFSQLRK